MIHALMGVYFGDLVEPSIIEEKQIHRQLITTVSEKKKRKAHLEGGRAVVVGSAVRLGLPLSLKSIIDDPWRHVCIYWPQRWYGKRST